MSETECPTCDRVFDTEAGVKQHHYATHNESIAGVDVECDSCSEIIKKRPSHVNEHNFCDDDCQGNWISEQRSIKVTTECAHCRSEFKIYPFRLEQADKHFCPDSNCYGEWRSENITGENHPNYTHVDVDCTNCGKKMTRPQWRIEQNKWHFCSEDCDAEHRSSINGENHPQWEGGSAQYGTGWNDKKKEAVRKHDNYECQLCGIGQEEYGRKLDVHHIQPARSFDDEEARNHPDNLTTLCRGCHQRAEQMAPLLPIAD